MAVTPHLISPLSPSVLSGSSARKICQNSQTKHQLLKMQLTGRKSSVLPFRGSETTFLTNSLWRPRADCVLQRGYRVRVCSRAHLPPPGLAPSVSPCCNTKGVEPVLGAVRTEAVLPQHDLEHGNSTLSAWASSPACHCTQNTGWRPPGTVDGQSPTPGDYLFLWVSSLTSDSPFLFRKSVWKCLLFSITWRFKSGPT